MQVVIFKATFWFHTSKFHILVPPTVHPGHLRVPAPSPFSQDLSPTELFGSYNVPADVTQPTKTSSTKTLWGESEAEGALNHISDTFMSNYHSWRLYFTKWKHIHLRSKQL